MSTQPNPPAGTFDGRKSLLLRKLRKIFFSSDSLVYAELLPPKGSIIQTGAGNCNVVRRSDFSKEFRSSHSYRTEVTGLRRWVGKKENFWLDRRTAVRRAIPAEKENTSENHIRLRK